MSNQHTHTDVCGIYGLFENIPNEAHQSPNYRIVERTEQGYRVEWVGRN